ncbi:MAG: hypothetical protein HZB51_27695 [Chloroflexi bacterium]|nr:hypothetical protein [Chloroflexota bacterium]
MRLRFTLLSSMVVLALIGVVASVPATPVMAMPTALNPNAPSSTVKLIFIHHSTGGNWLGDGNGNLGITLSDNNYFVSDTNYGWGPNPDGYPIGDRTDIPDWYSWFTGPYHNTYMAALFAETGQNAGYSRVLTDPGGENTVVIFKSCFPNSNLDGNPNDPPAASANNNSGLTVANAKRIYLDALNYFASRQDKLFVIITAPPLRQNDTNFTRATNARAFDEWLVNDYLKGYAYKNVAVFDFYNVLTTNGGDANTNDLNSADGNHHRYRNGVVEHISNRGTDYLAYPTGDSHPSAAGGQKASAEFAPLLNIALHCWRGEGSCAPFMGSTYQALLPLILR